MNVNPELHAAVMQPALTPLIPSPALATVDSQEMDSVVKVRNAIKTSRQFYLTSCMVIQISMSVYKILVITMPDVPTPMVPSPVLVILDSPEMESFLVKVTIARAKQILTIQQPFFQIFLNVTIILAMTMPPVVIPMVLSPVLVMLVSVEMESHLVKVTIASLC
jgi:hypothetical protein